MTMRNGGRIDWGDDTFESGSSPRSITLTMRQGPNPGHRFTVRKGNITIGRVPTNDVSIPEQQVSRHHANITWENDRFVIRDLGSANGTAVNGTQLTGPCPLRDGDVIGLGEIHRPARAPVVFAAGAGGIDATGEVELVLQWMRVFRVLGTVVVMGCRSR